MSALQPLGPDSASSRLQYGGAGEYEGTLGRVAKGVRLFATGGDGLIRFLETQPSRPTAVIVYGTVVSHWRKLLRWCGRRDIPLIGDVVDWYSPRQMPGGWVNWFANEYTLRRQVPLANGLIGISHFLCRHYEGHDLRAVRVPPVADVLAMDYSTERSSESDALHLVYAGVPENKDLLHHVFSALAATDPTGRGLMLHLVGPDERLVRQLWPDYPAAAVKLYGRLNHRETLAVVKRCDFSVLVRPDERYAHAGFSTKVVESFACGTPVIGNITSDLGMYLSHGSNSIVCERPSAGALVTAINEAMQLRVAWPAMRAAARRTAETGFDFRAYIDVVGRFLGEVVQCDRRRSGRGDELIA